MTSQGGGRYITGGVIAGRRDITGVCCSAIWLVCTLCRIVQSRFEGKQQLKHESTHTYHLSASNPVLVMPSPFPISIMLSLGFEYPVFYDGVGHVVRWAATTYDQLLLSNCCQLWREYVVNSAPHVIIMLTLATNPLHVLKGTSCDSVMHLCLPLGLHVWLVFPVGA